MIVLAVKGAFQMPVGRPRQSIRRGGSVIGSAAESGILQLQSALLSLGPLFVPSEVKHLLRRIVQIGGELAFPEAGVGRGLGIRYGRTMGVGVQFCIDADVRGRPLFRGSRKDEDETADSPSNTKGQVTSRDGSVFAAFPGFNHEEEQRPEGNTMGEGAQSRRRG